MLCSFIFKNKNPDCNFCSIIFKSRLLQIHQNVYKGWKGLQMSFRLHWLKCCQLVPTISIFHLWSYSIYDNQISIYLFIFNLKYVLFSSPEPTCSRWVFLSVVCRQYLLFNTLEATFCIQFSWQFIRTYITIKSRPRLKLGHVGHKLCH